MDKLNTRIMEHLLYKYLWQQGRYICFEVKMPNENGRYMQNDERVDCLSYETSGIWRFFELKLSVSDFHSQNKTTFFGNYNYFVMPDSVYEKVADEIPKEIGVYIVRKYKHTNNFGDDFYINLVRKAKKQELQVREDLLMFSLMQSLSRENQKYRRILKSVDMDQPVLIRNERFVKSIKSEELQ